MNIMVYDVAASSGGAVSILENYYTEHKQDKKNHYYYILSVVNLPDADNITVINVPQIKKNWFRRLIFDCFSVNKLIEKYNIDEVLSLQNTIIPFFNGRQVVYVHNALPFSQHRFSLMEDKVLWIYQNIIGEIIIRSVKRADQIIVQTDWMKEAVERITKSNKKIKVEFPSVYIPDNCVYDERENRNYFFYPANCSSFKNHKVIFEACHLLHEEGIDNYSVIFTLNGDETDKIQKIRDDFEMISSNIVWKGYMSKEEVFEMYSKSVLIFCSYIETVGLPIYEAMKVGSPILIADTDYSKNIATKYNLISYFPVNDAKTLKNLMKQYIRRPE